MWRSIQSHCSVTTDGIPGPKTLRAIIEKIKCNCSTWNDLQKLLGCHTTGEPDEALAKALIKKFSISVPKESIPTQADVRTGNSIFGKPGDEDNLVSVVFPYTMYYDGKVSKSIRVHKKLADNVRRIFEKTYEEYGERVHTDCNALSNHGGCFNFRKTRGGSSTSMHAWGIAIDLCPERNGMNDYAPKATLSDKRYSKFWDIVESEGAVSMGRKTGHDWMHFQFASF